MEKSKNQSLKRSRDGQTLGEERTTKGVKVEGMTAGSCVAVEDKNQKIDILDDKLTDNCKADDMAEAVVV